MEEDIKVLKEDLLYTPPKISAYHDMPFAIFCYDPKREFEFRKLVRLLASSIEQGHQKKITFISLARLLWDAIEKTEGLESIISVERQFGFDRAQETINTIISDSVFLPIADLLEDKIKTLNPDKDIVFLVRTAVFAPKIYRASLLLNQMYGRTMVPLVLFYPGRLGGGTDLRFMDMDFRGPNRAYNYRVKIYGGD